MANPTVIKLWDLLSRSDLCTGAWKDTPWDDLPVDVQREFITILAPGLYYDAVKHDDYVPPGPEFDDVDPVPCTDPGGHIWVVSDEDDDYCYCSNCGCMEY